MTPCFKVRASALDDGALSSNPRPFAAADAEEVEDTRPTGHRGIDVQDVDTGHDRTRSQRNPSFACKSDPQEDSSNSGPGLLNKKQVRKDNTLSVNVSPRGAVPYRSMNLLGDSHSSVLRSEFYDRSVNQAAQNGQGDNKSQNLLPPRAKKMVRKTKSSNNPGARYDETSNDQASLAKNRSASWRNFTSIQLNCPNKTKLKDYDIQVLIGQGAFGVVQRATLKGSHKKVAIKQYDKAKLCQDQVRIDGLRNEIYTLSKLDHDGIMKFYDAIDSGNKINIVIEYINGNNLYQYIRKRPGSRICDENEVKKIFKQVVESVAYMHSQNVVHRDLKLENVLITRDSKQTKLIDFGFSTEVKSMESSKLHFLCGTPIYMSPEIALKKEHLGGPADVWALGVILFILMTGKMPFHGAFEDDLYRKIS